jgi:glycine C-acetyltransferase
VQASLDVLEEEPERVERLRSITRYVRGAYREMGLSIRDSETPIIPILVGEEMKAYLFAQDLFQHGVFALPAVYPAVPKGCAVIRTAYMSTHEDRHIDFVLEVIGKLTRKYDILSCKTEGRENMTEFEEVLSAVC